MSGRDNIYLNGSILGMSRKQIDAATDAIIESSGLDEFIDIPVKVYSSGMYVRLGFAIAVSLEPETLITTRSSPSATRSSSVVASSAFTSCAGVA
ncbi:MAG: transporter related protein [Frankiales bacterium]|nr:transporter related protein [Frankiales bacterium]